MRLRRAAAAAFLLVLGLLLLAPVARADAGDASTTLRTKSIYIDPVAKDRGVRLSAIDLPAGVKIAVLPDTGVPALRLAADLVGQLRSGATTVGVFTVGDDSHVTFQATSSRYCAAYVDEQAQAASAAQAAAIDNLDLTRTVADFAHRLPGAPSDPNTAACASASALSPDTSSGGAVWPWIVGIAAVSAMGIGGFVMWSRRAREREPVGMVDSGAWW